MPGFMDIFKRKDIEKRLPDVVKIENEIIKGSIRQGILEKLNCKNPQVTLVIKEGEVVPKSLQNLKDIRITEIGTAANDWCNSWGDSKDGWSEGWGECFPTRPGEIIGRPGELEGGFHIRQQITNVLKGDALKVRLKEIFNDQEIEMLQKHNII